jgi:hypothetical protein
MKLIGSEPVSISDKLTHDRIQNFFGSHGQCTLEENGNNREAEHDGYTCCWSMVTFIYHGNGRRAI